MQALQNETQRINNQGDLMNNSRIMRVVQDSFGRLNERYKRNVNEAQPVQIQPMNNAHFLMNGVNFVPVPMNCPTIETHLNGSSPQVPKNLMNIKKEASVKENSSDSAQVNKYKFHNTKISKETNQEPHSAKSQESVSSNDSFRNRSYFFTGAIERILRWNANLKDRFYMYETVAPVVSLQEGSISQQKIMLLRDKKGPILQVQYYTTTHIDIDDFYIGQYLRCVGRMIGYNIMLAESIREAKEEEISTLPRLSYVCDYSITHNVKKD